MSLKTVTYWAEHGFHFEIPRDAIMDCTHQGRCDDDVDHWHRQVDFSHISDDDLAAELADCTDWDVSDRDTNERRMLWIACGHILEEWREDNAICSIETGGDDES